MNTCLDHDEDRASISSMGTPLSLIARRARDQLEPIIGPSGGGAGQSAGPSRPSIIQG